MGMIIPRKQNKVNKVDLSNISFDPEAGIKNLLMSRQNSMADNSNKKSKSKLYSFMRNLLPFKKLSSKTNRSFLLKSKNNKIADISDTIKNIETAFKPKHPKGKTHINQINHSYLQAFLIKNANNNDISRRKDTLYPSFLKKINEFKKNQIGLSEEDLHLFSIIKNYFKLKKTKKEEKSSNEIKKNKATLECLINQQKEKLDYYVDDIFLPEKRTLKQEILTLLPKSKENQMLMSPNTNKTIILASLILNGEPTQQPTINDHTLGMTSCLLNLNSNISIPKKNMCMFPYHKNKSLSPTNNRSNKNIADPTIKINKIDNVIENSDLFKSKLVTNINENSPTKKIGGTPIHSSLKPAFSKIVQNKCILPLRFKTSLKAAGSFSKFSDLKRRKTCFNDAVSPSAKNNIPVMTPIHEERSSSFKSRNKSLKDPADSFEESVDYYNGFPQPKHLKTEMECFNIESPNIKNPSNNQARIIQYGKWDFSKYCDSDSLERKVAKSRSFTKLQEDRERNNSGTPVRKVIRNGKIYNIVKKSDNLIIRNNKAVQILSNDTMFLERLKKKRWFDGLDHLSKISYKNVSPTMYYFCQNKAEQRKLLSFNE